MIAGPKIDSMSSLATPPELGKGLMLKGMFQGSPAIIKFQIPTKAALQEAYSTPNLPLDILSEGPPEKKFEWRLLARYGSPVSALLLVGLFVYVVVKPSKFNAAKGSKKRC